MAKVHKKLRNVIVPKYNKYKKPHKHLFCEMKTKYKNSSLIFGLSGLQLLKATIISPQQIEAARRTFIRGIKKKEKLWIKIKPQIAGTTKPENMRMGKGKGAVTYWKNYTYCGTILFEYTIYNKKRLTLLLKRTQQYLSVPSTIIQRSLFKK